MMNRILFVHNNFPAQFGFLAAARAARGDACAAIASQTGRAVAKVPLARYGVERGSTPGLFGPATRAEADLLRAEGAARAALALKEKGFAPDLIVGHPGWGETVFLRQVFPAARQILYGEFYYHPTGVDTGVDPEFGPVTHEQKLRIHAKNATAALAYTEADRIVAPTAFQGSLLPSVFRSRLRIVHEGVDTDAIRPAPSRRVVLKDGTVLEPNSPIVTFVNRRFEPMRGFHTFMRALPSLLEQVPQARVVLIGADTDGGYGLPAGEGMTWKARMLAELSGRLEASRLHFTGLLPHAEMHALLRLGAAHVYLTYPFALSWSMLEAMSLGCLVIGSRTAPVEEVIADGVNGRLVGMFDPDELADALVEACARPPAHAHLRVAARRTITDRYDRQRVCLPAWERLIAEVLAGGAPLPNGQATGSA